MTLIEHLSELRNRLFKAALFITVGTIVGWFLYEQLLELLKHPYCTLPAERRYNSANGQCQLVFFGIADGFMIRLKVAMIAGIVLSSPFWLYQLWAFVTPGLKHNERRYSIIFVVAGSVLFSLGVLMAYLVLPKAINVLVSFAGTGVAPLFSVKDYLSFITMMLVIFGVAFELPLVVVLLNFAGVLSYARLARSQRIAIFGIFVFAAVATPSQDPFSMIFMAVPLCVLYELAVLVARIHDKRKAARDGSAAYGDLPDNVPSPLDDRRASIDAPDPVEDDLPGR
ncbi:MAG TPA: twin-arginine translocase subunit TatC [Mycobacteriales bacterium]|nr:twin-arginine translocase subunit TatC [Mycobacteriales bacterium]